MSHTLVIDIFKNSHYGSFFNGFSDNDKENYYKLIEENYIKYNNLTIDEIYPDNDWCRMPNNNGSNTAFIDLTNYNYVNKTFLEVTQPNRNKQLYLVAYKCLKTKSIGFTWERNNSQVIHPFHIVKHDFELIDIDSHGVNYKCKICSIPGFKKKGAKTGEIVVSSKNMIYSCNEFLIKSIIE